ncbi:hypothetical protein ASG29_12410 [Sphingomonas sp. Leaf412]|nr:PEPxxWA-CTERM sorting domain-containing protein [Sphingomonas sp. Leaf412]KQT32561.1 hypothetical protein ASG29_12410 [Sphingomonas sp. Leaf412]
MMKKTLLGATVAIAAIVPSIATAQKVQSGSRNGLSYTATSRIIGQTSTATVATGGDPRYLALNSSGYSGSVGMLMTYANGDRFVCSGTLLSDRRSVLTAGHCVSNGGGQKAADLVRTQVIFANDAVSLSDASIYTLPAGTVAIDVGRYIVNSNYTGEVIDQNDIAVLKLDSFAPSFAKAYEIYTDDLKGAEFNVNGFGTRSTVGGAQGNTPPFNAGTGRRRQGNNIYDYAWGDSLFEGFFTDETNGRNFFGTADVEFSYISDFDNGLAAQDQSRRIANALGLGAIGDANFANTGVGAMEVGVAGGDSGGAAFIDGKISSVNSYGLTFGASFGDFGGGLNAGWGEFSGYVPTSIHQGFITSAIAAGVPEPTTWALMILGMGAVGGAMRRRAKTTVRFA